MDRKTENVATALIVVFSLLSVMVSGIAYKPIKITEYDGPRIIATHEITADQLVNSAYIQFEADKHGNRAVTVERAAYEGIITESQAAQMKAAGYPLMEVPKGG